MCWWNSWPANRLLAAWRATQNLSRPSKRSPSGLPHLLPTELAENETLMLFCRRLVEPDPADRFASAEDADLSDCGAASIQRQLVKMDLASEYTHEIRLWLQDLV